MSSPVSRPTCTFPEPAHWHGVQAVLVCLVLGATCIGVAWLKQVTEAPQQEPVLETVRWSDDLVLSTESVVAPRIPACDPAGDFVEWVAWDCR